MTPARDTTASPRLAFLAHAARRTRTACRAFATAFLLVAAAAAHGQGTEDAERCATITGNPDLAIKHCTAAIGSGKLSGNALAQIYYSRGIEWAAKNDHERAIADYDAAIKINPKFTDAFFNRGHAWGAKGDPDRAIADYEAALRLNPKDATAHAARAVELTVKGEYPQAIAGSDTSITLDPKSGTALLGRGRAYFYSGDFQRAVADMERAFKLEPNLYTAMWLYLARKHGKALDAEEMLDSETRGHRDGGWPSPVVVLFVGRTDVDSVMAAATDRDAKKQSEQRCEASFYLGHWHLLRGDRERAVALLKEAQAGCPRDFLEHEGAVAELRRLGGKPQ
jgi:lipoprotein NlpI